MTDADRLLTSQEVADYLGISLSTLYGWRYINRGPRGFKVGKHIRFRRADILEWLDRQADPKPAA